MSKLQINTSNGIVVGTERKTVAAFYGIPFAAPPIGKEGRWQAAAPAMSVAVDFPAHSFGPVCPQPEGEGLAHDPALTQFSEDCLNLNIFAPLSKIPANSDSQSGLPVLFWVHGGGYITGAGSGGIYRSTELVETERVILVTINYRLGPFGFLRLTELTDGIIPATGNEGILDQLTALQWVYENIAAFGGDRDNITVFGESAGGMSVANLLSMPAANKMMRRCIVQSGSAEDVLTPQLATERAKTFGTHLLDDKENAETLTPSQWADTFYKASSSDLLNAYEAMRTSSTPLWSKSAVAQSHAALIGLAFAPVGDGETLPKLPLDAIKAGVAKDVELTAGFNEDEWTFFCAFSESDWNQSKETALSRLQTLIDQSSKPQDPLKNTTADGIYNAYESILKEQGKAHHPGAVFAKVFGMATFGFPTFRLLNAQANAGGKARGYCFRWRSPLANGILGACHALELPFVFGGKERAGLKEFAGTGETADKLQAAIQENWINIACGTDLTLSDGLTWPHWQKPNAENSTPAVASFGLSADRIAAVDKVSHIDPFWQ